MTNDQSNAQRPQRQSNFVPGRGGARMFSMAALAERIREEFLLEYAGTEVLRDAVTATKRMQLVLGVTDYIIAVESLTILLEDKADLMQRVYSELFGYGALDAFFADLNVTTIAINGADSVAVRYGHGDLQEKGHLFGDADHLHTVIERLLTDAGTGWREDLPVVEAGLKIGERLASLSVVMPSFSFGLTADIRLHPLIAPTLDDLVASEVMLSDAAVLIKAITASKFGFIIAGETETGKTTLLNAIALELLKGEAGVGAAVERTGELRLPTEVTRLRPDWGQENGLEITFGDRIREVVEQSPPYLLIDEVRADEPTSIAPLLDRADTPRQIWSFRGAPDHKRMQSALGMLARRADSTAGERLVHALYDRLPFIITLARIRGRLHVFSIAEWQSRIDTDYPDYVQLFRFQEGAARRTDAQLARWVM